MAHTGPQTLSSWPRICATRSWARRAAQGTSTGFCATVLSRSPRSRDFWWPTKAANTRCTTTRNRFPRPDSRITLAEENDSFGMPRASIDLRFTEQDVQSVIDSHRLLDEALQENGIGRLEYLYRAEELRERVYAQAADGYHQAGTTRMGEHPGQSVVDANLKVHGMENLFVASSSVFPTTGQANSTLLAVAFGVRLANHLHAKKPELA